MERAEIVVYMEGRCDIKIATLFYLWWGSFVLLHLILIFRMENCFYTSLNWLCKHPYFEFLIVFAS